MSYTELQEENTQLKQQIQQYESRLNEITYAAFIIVPLAVVGFAYTVNYFFGNKKRG
jgi:cell division septum initiation protein DivIVA